MLNYTFRITFFYNYLKLTKLLKIIIYDMITMITIFINDLFINAVYRQEK